MRKYLGKTTIQEHLLNAFIVISIALVLGVSVLSVMYMVTNLFTLIVGGENAQVFK